MGEEITDGEKFGSDHIKIIREIIGEELDILAGKINGNTGIFNTGDRNTGNCNTGNCNTGNCNTGDFNSCDFSAGFFCTEEPKARIFDIETDFTVSEFMGSKWYNALYSVPLILTDWKEYSEKEKRADENKKLIGGKLIKYDFKAACAAWWKKMSDENKAIIKTIPNFDADKFEYITGIRVKEYNNG